MSAPNTRDADAAPTAIGSRRELFVDDCLVERMSGGAELRLHRPTPREVVLVTDAPWEGNGCGFFTVFEDDGLYRMYYKAWRIALTGEKYVRAPALNIAYAESDDAVHWRKPELGLVEWEGSAANNLIIEGSDPDAKGVHGFAPFRDPNPDCPPEQRYKAVGAMNKAAEDGLFALISPDGVRWSLLTEDAIITKGKFDSQNLVFWDPVRGVYRAYVRDFREQDGVRCRDIRTATSPDFLHWSEPQWLEYPGAPDEQLYTNQVLPYYRAPHILMGFPSRYVAREWSPTIEALPELEHRRLRSAAQERFGTATTDGLFMTSRDGRVFRRWGEAFLRPGPQLEGNWTYGDNYQAWGLVETPSGLEGAPREISLYATENYWRGPTRFRRHTIRVDGFVSLQAPLSGGEIVTKPLTFEGARLELNLSTSAAGSVKVEVRDAGDSPIEGFALKDCWDAVGDRLDYIASWKDGPDVSALAGRPVRLRFVLKDADLYSFRFAGA